MLETLRKPGSFIVKTGSIVGGVYMVRAYMRERLDDVREKMEEERRATESLRARFSQTQEDVAYTVLALLPTLSKQVLEEMDVDVLTRELQARSRARSEKIIAAVPKPPSSLTSSIVEVPAYPPAPYPPFQTTSSEVDVDTRSDIDSVAQSSDAGSHTSEAYPPSSRSGYYTAVSASFVSERSVTQSWVMDSSGESAAERSRSPAASAVSNGISEASEDERMSESIVSTTTNTTNSSETDTADHRTKAELWNELKLLTFTRTLTTLYASTLLSLLTTLQLTLLARGKYVNSILQAEKQERMEEQMRQRMERELSPANLLLKGMTSWVGGMLNGHRDGAQDGLESLFQGLGLDKEFAMEDDVEITGQGGDNAESGIWLGEIDELESKYLTMSWWLLHVGWKDVSERVRRAVEEVFNGVSLKTKLSAIDLHRLIADVRRRVEHEITFEGTEKKTNFLSSLLPPTPETIHHVLTQGGYTSPSTSHVSQFAYAANPHHIIPTEARSPQDLSSDADYNFEHQNPSGSSILSATSSQLSRSFVNSPVLAVSAHPHHHQQHQLHQQHPSSHLQQSQRPSGDVYYHPPPPPPPQYAALLDAPFLSLLDETRTILSSPNFERVLEVSLDRATEVLFDGLERNVFGSLGGGSGTQNGDAERIRLAGLLPGLARWSQLALEGLPNELVDKTLGLREVGCLSAITFSRFEERFQ